MNKDEWPMKKSQSVRDEIERGYEIGPPGNSMLSATGEPFVELYGLGGAEKAVESFRSYANGKAGRLYWRTTPEIEDTGKFYMRVLISDRKLRERRPEVSDGASV
jgi:hypothetical protein